MSEENKLTRHISDFFGLNKQPVCVTPEQKWARKKVLFRAFFSELACTCIFLYIVCASVLNMKRVLGNEPVIEMVFGAVSAGFTAVGVIYTFADMSGAHFNPAVTFATWVSGKTSNRKSFMYLVAQIIGSILAMALICATFPNPTELIGSYLGVAPSPDVNLGHAWMMEVMLTFCFVFVIFTTAFATVDPGKIATHAADHHLTIYTANPQSKGGLAPLAIGLTLGTLTLVGGTISGGAFNPVRVFAPAVFGAPWKHQWIYWVGDFTGAGLAALLHTVFTRTKIEDPKEANAATQRMQVTMETKGSDSNV